MVTVIFQQSGKRNAKQGEKEKTDNVAVGGGLDRCRRRLENAVFNLKNNSGRGLPFANSIYF